MKANPKAGVNQQALELIELIEARQQEMDATRYRLASIVKLAAFAAEARRTLEEFTASIEVFPEAEAYLLNAVQKSQQWGVMEDATGEVLAEVSRQLESSFELEGDIYKLRKVLEATQ